MLLLKTLKVIRNSTILITALGAKCTLTWSILTKRGSCRFYQVSRAMLSSSPKKEKYILRSRFKTNTCRQPSKIQELEFLRRIRKSYLRCLDSQKKLNHKIKMEWDSGSSSLNKQFSNLEETSGLTQGLERGQPSPSNLKLSLYKKLPRTRHRRLILFPTH